MILGMNGAVWCASVPAMWHPWFSIAPLLCCSQGCTMGASQQAAALTGFGLEGSTHSGLKSYWYSVVCPVLTELLAWTKPEGQILQQKNVFLLDDQGQAWGCRKAVIAGCPACCILSWEVSPCSFCWIWVTLVSDALQIRFQVISDHVLP